MDLHQAPMVFERLVHEDEVKGVRVYLTVNTFRGVEYMHLRKYYQDFNEEWKPTPEGVAMPLDFNNSRELFEGLLEILSLAESKSILEDHFKDSLDKMYQK